MRLIDEGAGVPETMRLGKEDLDRREQEWRG